MTLSVTSPPRRAREEASPRTPNEDDGAGGRRLGLSERAASSSQGVVDAGRLAADPDRTAAPPGRPPRPAVSERRRRVAGVLGGSTAGFMIAATLSGAVVLWIPAASAGMLAVVYCTAALCVSRRAERRDLDLAFRSQAPNPRALDWDLEPEMRVEDVGGVAAEEPFETEMSRSEAVRFLVAYFAAWALTPLVILVHLISGNRVDLERYEVIRRLIRFQGHWRSKSLRMAGIAAMSTVTVVGAAGGSAFASSYTVKPGDDLFRIALANGTTVAQLAALNHIANPNFIVAGQVINLSGSTSAASASGNYLVRPGDTLWQISRTHGTTVAALAAANHIANPDLIFAGSTLTLDPPPPPPPPPPAPATQTAVADPPASGGAVAVQTALAQIGVPYVFGGNTPASGFDCSGLVQFAWASAGVSIPHYSVSQWDSTTRISEDQLQPGDIVFYNNGQGGPQPGHEALYIGNGQVVASNHPGTAVQVQSITWVGPPMGFGRVG
ncbi:MAG: LysM peptidoglycan-binding domain-containing protein [Acidimicrobiaceae bacterium]|nr:LysM peptidoglycan-binding domain-containing protein [Acidimicrobiaceae bacterium]